jgi:hypothetical protein
LCRGAPPAVAPQSANEGAYYSYPGIEDWENFRRRGWATVAPSDLDAVLRRYLVY